MEADCFDVDQEGSDTATSLGVSSVPMLAVDTSHVPSISVRSTEFFDIVSATRVNNYTYHNAISIAYYERNCSMFRWLSTRHVVGIK